jgi:HAD superfamily hydrolase (TIGR01509 family)
MLVIFDCDGVLLDSELISSRAHADALAALGLPFKAADVLRRFTGMPDRAMYALIEAEHGIRLPSDHDAGVKARVAEAYRTELRAIPGVHAAVAAIGDPACVASSSTPEKLALGLGLVGLHDRFAPHVFSASQVERGKPAPDLFLFAARTMGAAPADCLVIEDSLAGVQAARAAGMRVIGFTAGSHCGPGHGARLVGEGAEAVAGDWPEAVAMVFSARAGA